MTQYQWLLGLHVVGAFLFVSGAVAAGALQWRARLRDRPSEIALLLELTRIAVVIVAAGLLATVAFGAWLVSRGEFHWGDAWIVAALALVVVSVIAGTVGGRSARHARYLAERLAAAGDEASGELKRALADPKALALNYTSFLAALAVLALMVWKPGS